MVNFLAAWLTAFMTTAINIALPSIQTEFRLGAVPMGWLPLGYVLAMAILMLPFGRVGDRYGRRLLPRGLVVCRQFDSPRPRELLCPANAFPDTWEWGRP